MPWQHIAHRSMSIIIGRRTFALDRDGVVSPDPDEATAAIMARIGRYRFLGEPTQAPVVEVAPEPAPVVEVAPEKAPAPFVAAPVIAALKKKQAGK